MRSKNLLIISNNFPDKKDGYIGNVFVKEQVKHLKKYFENIYVVSPVAYGIKYLRKTKYEDYQFDNVHMYFPKYFNFPLFYFYFRDFWVYLETRAILKVLKRVNANFDLIHAHFAWPSGAVAIELKEELGIPVVITHHDRPLTLYKVVRKKDRIHRRMWNLCDAIIVIQKAYIGLLSNAKAPLDRTYYIPDGYDPKKLPKLDKRFCREKLNLPLDKKIIFTISTLTEVKGHKYSIGAMKEVVENRRDILYIIGGSGPLRNKLQKQIDELNLQDYIKLIGFISSDELSLWMNACDVFVLPSLGEGFGIVQIEAMACEKPVVATYNGGSEEIITSEDYGYLVEPANPKELAKKISIALDKEWNGEKIRKYAERFTWENIAEEILNVYEGVLK